MGNGELNFPNISPQEQSPKQESLSCDAKLMSTTPQGKTIIRDENSFKWKACQVNEVKCH